MRPSAASPRPADRRSANAAGTAEFAGDVGYYLSLEPRQLPSKYLYDQLGSALFEAICELPWYHITRAELGLLAEHRQAILGLPASLPRRIVELGPGSGVKLKTLLAESAPVITGSGLEVHLIDVSPRALDEAGRMLATLGGVDVVRHEATYEDGLHRLPPIGGRTLTLFLGSNVGNFDRPAALAFLRQVRAALAHGDELLLGADLVKPEADLLLAYDDPLGVTAAFNKNLLARINRELGGDFNLGAFKHRAIWNAGESRVEMHLVSTRRQRVRIEAAGVDIDLRTCETIWTESSYKYEPANLEALLSSVGFAPMARWIAAGERFGLTLARAT